MRCSVTAYHGTVGEKAKEEQLGPPASGAADVRAASAAGLPARGVPTGVPTAGLPARLPTAGSAALQQRRGPTLDAQQHELAAGVPSRLTSRASLLPAIHPQHGLQPPRARVLPAQQLRAR